MKCPNCSRELGDKGGLCPECETLLLPGGVETTRPSTVPSRWRARASAWERPFVPGTVLAERYRIIHKLGHGAMGEVYRADDLVLGQEVALKFLPPTLEAYLARLLAHEVRIARQISHPNVCQVYDLGHAAELRFLSMEYIDGENLASFLRRVGRLPPERAVAMGREICGGLAAVHDKGILHRDLKPSNLMIDGAGRVRITDFGIAALAGTVEGRDIRHGTPAYMAPEQAAGLEVTAKSDLYALGLVLYELVTGVRAADKATPEGPPRQVDGLDPDVDRIIRQCLVDDPAERPSSAREIAEVLGASAAPTWRAAAGQAVPQRPQWVLERQLGQGGFGEVWLAAHDKAAEKRVFKFCYDATRLSALKREITLFRLLREELGERHDIVRILDWSFDEPPFFIESEFSDGGNLLEWAEAQGGLERVPLTARLEIAAQVAETLAAAHSVGVLHKDVKPANVLLRDRSATPRTCLSDFGIGWLLDASRLTDAGITVLGLTHSDLGDASSTGGTILYRAPELYEDKPATVQADIYSLGVMLYQLATGNPRRALGPGWEHDVDDELLREDIAAVVDRDPRRRLADAAVLADRLRSLEARHAELEATRRQREEARRNRRELERATRRRRLLAAVLGVALLVTSVVIVYAGRLAREVARRREMTRVAVAGEWLNRDPTRAALVLLEIERPDEIPFAVDRFRQALQHKLGLFELRHDADLVAAAWNPAGTLLLTAAENGMLRLYRAAERSAPLEFEGCRQTATAIAWRPDSERFAATCLDGTVRVWHGAPDRAPILEATLEHPDRVLAAAWSPDGERLATTSRDGTARVWRLATGTDVVLEGHTDAVSAVAWSPDGKHLATASYDSTVRVWNPAGGASRVLEHGAGHRVWMAAWSPDGKHLATASNDATARIWNVGSPAGSAAIVLSDHKAGVRLAAWSPDGRWLLTASQDRTARVWSSTGQLLTVLEHPLGLRVAAWSPDGAWILTASEDGVARVWRFSATSPLGDPIVFASRGAWMMAGGWSPDGERIFTLSRDTVRVWPAGDALTEPGSGEPRVLDRHRGIVRTATWNPAGERVVTASDDTTAIIWRPGTGRPGTGRPPRVLAGHAGPVRAASWSPDGERVVTASDDGTARIWGADSADAPNRADGPNSAGEPIVLTGHSEGLTVAAFDPSGDRVLTASTDGTVRIRTVVGAGGEAIVSEAIVLVAGGPVVEAVWSGDGTRVAVATKRTLQVWPADGDIVSPPRSPQGDGPIAFTGHREDLRTVAWSPDDTRIVSASYDGTACVWRADGLGPPIVLDHGVVTPVRTAAFDPSGTRVVTGLDNGEVRVWRADGLGTPIFLDRHPFAVTSAVFSPDGAWILSSSVADTVRVRRADGTGRPAVLPGHRARVETAAWSPRGDRIVTASRDGTARVWRFHTSDLITRLREATTVCLDPEFRAETLGDSSAEAERRYRECERSHGR